MGRGALGSSGRTGASGDLLGQERKEVSVRRGRDMSFAYLPLYTGDYLRDTRHLTPLKHGVYLLLLMHCWDQKGPLPLDEQECAGIANCRSADEVEALRYMLQRFFVQMEDGYYNKRMQQEVTRAASLSASRSDAGKRGSAARMRRSRASKRQAKALSEKTIKQVSSKSLASDTSPTPISTTTRSNTNSILSLSLIPTPVASPDFQSGSAGVLIPLVGKKEWQVPLAYLAELETAYPSVDGVATLREIRAWCVSNPTKCKTERGIRVFINRWFEKEHNHG